MRPYYLDGPLYYLGRDLPEVLDLLMLETPGGKAVLLFREEALAGSHLSRLPEDLRVQHIPAEDFRAKEELLRAALAEDAVSIWLDTDPTTLEPAERLRTRSALDYVLSFKSEVACF